MCSATAAAGTAEPIAPLIRLALIGDPVEHSASPALHGAHLRDAGLLGTYEAIRVPAGGCAAALAELRARDFRGTNVTTPLKEEAAAVCTSLDAVAAATGAVSTIVFAAEEVSGHNTDGIGARAALRAALGRDVDGISALVLGAGPTGRAAAHALRDAGARVTLWNRTRERGEAAARALGVTPWQAGGAYDCVLSALAPGSALEDADLVREVVGAQVVVDANYGPRATLEATLGRPVVDGQGMLRASARASFALFVAG